MKKRDSKPFDFILFITIIVLLAMGIIMVLSASSPSALSKTQNSYSYVTKQATFAVLGFACMLIISKIDYRIYAKFYKIIYIIVVLMLLAVPIIGHNAKGATRWIDLGFTTFQPSELAKIGLIIFYATWLTKNKDNLKKQIKGFWVPILYLAPVAFILVFLQDHLSATVVIAMIVAIMMLMAGSRLRYFMTYGIAGVTAGGIGLYVVAKLTGIGLFRIDRITAFLNPWEDPTGTGWQIIQSLYAIGSGGIFGVGLGESKQKFLYIPEPHNDFIFSVLAEELGFVGCAVVIILFAIFIWRGLVIAMKAPDMFGSLVAVGITALVGIQAIINIAVVTSSMPNTGMPLPFFSYGGTALVILLCSVRCTIKHIKKLQKSIKGRVKKMKVIIAAAGTAGHINPGIAIANKIKEEEPNSKIIFMGTARGLENDLVQRAGYELKTVEAYGLAKKISLDNLSKIMKTMKGIGQAKKIVKEFEPDIVIGTGGYICGSAILAARKYSVPTMLHESNAFPR